MARPIALPAAAAAWGTEAFRATLKRELEALPAAVLPLQEGLSTSSYALDEPVTAVVIAAEAVAGAIRARAGLFYQGIIAGCSCADDPTPTEPQNEYCEVMLAIDPASGVATVSLAED
ncbi:MAG: hypothetical protein PHS77_13325 [Gallionellaceae bacterium]|nr:hypothetical protein [Gallionellaceae bacterium]